MFLAGRFLAFFESPKTFEFHLHAIVAELGAEHLSAVFESCLKFHLRLLGKVKVILL